MKSEPPRTGGEDGSAGGAVSGGGVTCGRLSVSAGGVSTIGASVGRAELAGACVAAPLGAFVLAGGVVRVVPPGCPVAPGALVGPGFSEELGISPGTPEEGEGTEGAGSAAVWTGTEATGTSISPAVSR